MIWKKQKKILEKNKWNGKGSISFEQCNGYCVSRKEII